MPAGWTDSGLPVGRQIIGRHLDDATVIRPAAAIERVALWAHEVHLAGAHGRQREIAVHAFGCQCRDASDFSSWWTTRSRKASTSSR
ncbi:hypothetical protein [Nocardia sp. NPDC004860]|uniref:hypothetical protein n=1 Tax=Nocardia sp. NPDC004860 TaxID=3154557 RepID=UPI0033AA0871